MTTNEKRSIELLQEPSLNKSTAFTEEENRPLGLLVCCRHLLLSVLD